jgi:hypothetical protein
MNYGSLPKEISYDSAPWAREVIRPTVSGGPLFATVPIIEAHPQTYGVPEGYHAVTLDANSVWVGNIDPDDQGRGVWRDERTIDLTHPQAHMAALDAVRGLQTRRGTRYVLLSEQDGWVTRCTPQEVVGLIHGEMDAPAHPDGISRADSTGTDEWHIYSRIPHKTTFLLANTVSRMVAFDRT